LPAPIPMMKTFRIFKRPPLNPRTKPQFLETCLA
jgi:hypothetical protein